jgi:hypothetical protein
MGFKEWFNDPAYRAGYGSKSYWKSWNDDLYGGYDYSSYTSYTSTALVQSPQDKAKKVCEDGLRAIGRSANVILNSGDENERKLSVKFSDGTDVNTISDNTIYISPDDLVKADGGVTEDDVVDSLCGQVMMAAQLKRQIDSDTYQEFTRSDDMDVKAVWSAIEFAIARGDIINDWRGFKPYFDNYSIASSVVTSKVIKQLLKSHDGSSPESKTSSKAFVKGLAWNLYHSHDPIKIPAVYNEGKMAIAEGLASVRTPKDRWYLAEEVVKLFRKLYDGAPEEEEETDPSEDMVNILSKEGLIEEASKPAPVLPKKGADKFSGIDESLFGLAKVGNSSCFDASSIDAISGDKTSELKDTISPPGVPIVCGIGGGGLSIKAVWVPPDSKNENAKYFDATRMQMIEAFTERLRDSFSFKSKEASKKIFGYNSGRLHSNSLYKIGMDLDTVFYRRSHCDSDKIAICLLVDQSGSMKNETGNNSSRIREAAEVAYILAKLCKGIKDVDLTVVGFSAQESSREAHNMGVCSSDEMNMRLIYDELDASVPLDNILKMCGHGNNLDGYSVWHAAKHLQESRPDYKRKVMIVISDGQPNGSNYGGDSAHEHVNMCRKDARARFGVETYAIGVANAYPAALGDKMYGPGNNIIISDVKSSIGYLSRFLNQLADSTE